MRRNPDPIVTRLETSPFFNNFSETEIDTLAKNDSAFVTFRKESFICKEGDIDQAVFIILSGQVQVSKKTSFGQANIINLKTGSIFGEISLLRKDKRISNVQALEETMVCKLTPEQIKKMNVQLQVKIKGQILNLVIKRYEILCDKYAELVNLKSY